MKRKVVAVTLMLVAAVVSGCIFSSDDDKDVKKGKVSGKITMTITGEPVANVKVMLVNQNARIDTVNYANNAKALVDSAVTDTNGEFVIEGVAPGKYGVIPVNSDTDSTHVYKFSLSGDAGSYEFSLNGESRTVNFIAESMNVPGASDSYFIIDVVLKNVYYPLESICCDRECHLGLLPGWKGSMPLFPTEIEPHTYLVKICTTYGYTCLFYTETNNFMVRPTFKSPDPMYHDFYLGHDFRATPAYSKFEYDLFTRAVTRVQ